MTQQENQQNLYAFAELEYMLRSYFDKNVRGIVDGSYKDLKAKQQAEYRRLLDARPVAPGQSGMMNAGRAAQEVSRTGEWNTKHTEYLVDTIQQKIYKDNSATQLDIGDLMNEWKKLAVSRLGASEYKRLSAGVPGGDLAAYYVSKRIDDMAFKRIVKLGAPQSTVEYVIRTGMKESAIGQASVLLSGGDDSSPLDRRVARMQEESFGEGATFAGRALGFGIDMLTPGMKVKGIWAAADIATRGYVYSKQDGDKSWKDAATFEKDLGKALFGDESGFVQLRASGLGINQSSDGVQVLNAKMRKKVFGSTVDMNKVQAVQKEVVCGVNGDAQAMANLVHQKLKSGRFAIKESSAVPGWMLQKDGKWLLAQAAYYSALALEMKSKGITEKKLGDKMWNVNAIAQRGYDYSVAAYQKQLSEVREELQVAEGEEVTFDNMSHHSQSTQQRQMSQYQASSYQGQQPAGQSARPSAQQVPAGQPGASYAPMSAGGETQLPSGNAQNTGGWGDLFDMFGLNGFGAVGKNLGYCLAMLPDMLIGMFTGKSKNLQFKDCLFPLAAIIFGMKTKSPILKMLLIGLGSANLLNKAGHAALDQGGTAQPQVSRQYRKYDDEPLDVRIKNPAMKGNTLLATIDGVPNVITVNEEAADAYYKGLVPMNVLCNAVLRKYDEQKQAVEENYERQASRSEVVERGRGII